MSSSTGSAGPGGAQSFSRAGGVVLESGGALWQGAVIAREYGLPCVSGLDGVMERICDGQIIEVDGSNGVVRLDVSVEPPAKK